MNHVALKGIRVADFSWVWAGPYATLLLSFLGADVIKIESRQRVDQTRQGTITTGEDFEGFNASPIFNNANLNKKSVSLDLKNPEAVELAKKIVAESDIVIENMRPGVMDKLGLGYKDLVKIKPNIIMISSSGFGSSGPYGEYAGYAPIFAAIGGLAYLTGYEGGEPNTMSGVMDLRVGTMSAFAILAALLHRQKTGEGQYIDLSSSECISSLIGPELMEYTMNKRSPNRRGNQDSIMAPHNCYRCKGDDKWISIAVATDEEWKALCGAMGNPEWAQDEAFADVYSRWKNRHQLDEYIAAWTINCTDYEVMTRLQSAGVAATPSFNAEQILSDPHVKARGKIIEVEHPVMGKKKVITPPWKLSETPATISKASPLLGEHNEEVFSSLLGMSKEEIQKLVDEKVIY
ncbi:CaiB/BaiF CoA transferase family protein [Paenibacillus thalictri]|uniref:CoA transferase n=1 Tax=Paenibacillus thalictri TaxID=2527873 RepID=A0A4Q9DLZ2_9BACL|nr:CoA transferase [Paenibacillus thalictri]TBL76305.1 CoA transferase [Paenibacillus thalictri]